MMVKSAAKRTLNLFGLGATVRDLRREAEYLFDFKTRHRNARFQAHDAPDGLPMPPAKLVYLVTGQFDVEAFYRNGAIGAEWIQHTLRRHGLQLNSFRKILDFGCGCGRVLRHWRKLSATDIYGVDYNPLLIDWCRQHLSFAHFGVNRMGVPLGFPDGTFDFIYSISVFTHLTEASQRFWMNELFRMLKPGGYLLFTVHGLSRLHELPQADRQRFENGEPVILGSQYSGTNFCGTYHPKQYIQNVLCQQWRLVAFEPGGAKDARQDLFLMEKPSANN